jgi:uncharacterized protein YbbC (DUF1343 family)
MNMLRYSLEAVALAGIFFFTAQTGAQTARVLPGIEVLREQQFAPLKGKRIGLITNPTGVDGKLRSTIDILANAPGVKLVSLFGPEHGVRGDFEGGAYVESYIDSTTKLPVYSLYGKTRKPTPEMLKGLDALVYDIQDIGCRPYTFISTMGLAMEAAAENNLQFFVLDRPNPLGGLRVEGNIVEKGFESFIGQYPIPYVYGLTCGELAQYLNGEGLLKNAKKAQLTVIPMRGWKRWMTFSMTGLPWVPTSPHIPEETTPFYNICTGLLGELGVVSEGVGYTIPFHVLAAEWIDPEQLAARMNALALPGLLFRPITFKAFYGAHNGKELRGVQIYITDERVADLLSTQFYFLQAHNDLYPDKNIFELAGSSRIQSFDKAAGTDAIRKLFSRRMQVADIRSFLNKDIAAFKSRSAAYLLYR